MKERQIILIGLAAGVAFGLVAWNYLSRRNEEKMKLRKPPPGTTQRSADRPLTRQELRIKKQSKKLIAKGRIVQAAQLLEQGGFHRDAIDALENGRLFDDAARVLMRLQRPGRAGVLYSRNGLFEPAAQCFMQAGDHLNAAKCFKEAGKLVEAAELFSKSAQFLEAAECLEKAGLVQEAARAWIKANKLPEALSCWDKLGQQPSSPLAFKPSSDEIEIISHAIKGGSTQPGLMKLAANSPQAADLIMDLLSKGAVAAAGEIFQQAPQQISSHLLREINIQSAAAPHLVDMFKLKSQFRNAGVLLEQLSRFSDAAEAFTKAGDKERAAYCLTRTSDSSAQAAADSPERQPVAEVPKNTTIPRANFFIETATQDGLKSASSAVKPIVSATITVESKPSAPPVVSSGAKSPLSTDEERLLNRSWLFAGVNEEDVERIVARFAAYEFNAGHRILSGSSTMVLVMCVTGDFVCDQRSEPLDGWLSPEIGLSDQPALEWSVISETARVIAISAAEFGAILSQDADLTRQVYINLTQRLAPPNGKQLFLKAI